jgi:Mg2+-importing ATPase
MTVSDAATSDVDGVLAALGSSPTGLSAADAHHRLAQVGPNAVRSHHAQPLKVLARQLQSPVLVLLAATASISSLLGQRVDTLVIGTILLASIALGFLNEYRAERATEALHSQVTHTAVTLRDGARTEVDVTELVPGDVVHLALGEVVPADIRLLETSNLQCDESVLTGESLPADKSTSTVSPGSALGDLTCCAFMGTVVRAGSGAGLVVATGARGVRVDRGRPG